MKRAFSLFLCAALLLGFVSCSPSKEDKLYDELTAKSSAASSEAAPSSAPEESEPEESEVSQAESEEEVPEDPERYVQKLEWNQLFDIVPNTELSGTLTIGTHSSKLLEPWIEAFNAAYPNVEIKTKLYSITSDEASEELIVDLNSGAAGDILHLGTLSLFKYGESGLLLDLYPFIDASPDLQREDLYTNMLTAMETEGGKLCAVSPTASIGAVYFNTMVTERLGINFRNDYPDGMTPKDITDLYQRCIQEDVLDETAFLSPLGSKMYLFLDTVMDYFDEQHSESDFENPGFVEHLEVMDRIPAAMPLLADAWAVDYSFQYEDEFMVLGQDSFSILDHYWENDKKANRSVWVPLKTESGKKPFQTGLPLGITSSCQNPELAWEFLKFMLTDKPFPQKPEKGYTDIAYMQLYNNEVPVNRKTFEHLFCAYYDDDELYQYLDDMYSQRDVVKFTDGHLLSAWMDILTSYWENGLISAEECAKQLQERTWIYMNE